VFGPVDHRNSNAVFDRITGIEAFHLGKNLGFDFVLFCEVIDPNQRRIADQTKYVVVRFHELKSRGELQVYS
jgi:hypothetical protein